MHSGSSVTGALNYMGWSGRVIFSGLGWTDNQLQIQSPGSVEWISGAHTSNTALIVGSGSSFTLKGGSLGGSMQISGQLIATGGTISSTATVVGTTNGFIQCNPGVLWAGGASINRATLILIGVSMAVDPAKSLEIPDPAGSITLYVQQSSEPHPTPKHLSSLAWCVCCVLCAVWNSIDIDWTSNGGGGIGGTGVGKLNVVRSTVTTGSWSVAYVNATDSILGGSLSISAQAQGVDLYNVQLTSNMTVTNTTSVAAASSLRILCAGTNNINPRALTLAADTVFRIDSVARSVCTMIMRSSVVAVQPNTQIVLSTHPRVQVSNLTTTNSFVIRSAGGWFTSLGGNCAGQWIGSDDVRYVCSGPIPSDSLLRCNSSSGSTEFTWKASQSVPSSGAFEVASGCVFGSSSVAAPLGSTTNFTLNGGVFLSGATFRGSACALNYGEIMGPTTSTFLRCVTLSGPPTDNELRLR